MRTRRRTVAGLGLRAGRRQVAADRGGLLLGRRQRLRHLAVVPVDGHGLDAETPGVDVELLHVLDRHVLGHVHRLGDGPADEGLHRPHHADVARVVDGVVAHGAGEDGQVLGGDVRRAEDRHVLVDVGDDVLGLLDPVAQLGQRPWNRLVDDRHRAAADQLLGLDQTEVGLDARRVAVHQQADGPRRRQHRRLRVAHAVRLGQVDRPVPGLLGRREQLGRHDVLVDAGRLGLVHAQDVEHRLGVLVEAGEGAHAGRGAGRRGVGVPRQQCRDGGRPGPTGVGVVGQALRHEQRAQVGVADAELAEGARRLPDPLGRVVGVADDDLLPGEHDRHPCLEALHVELVVLVEERQQVHGGQIAGRVVEVHIFAARVAAVDAARHRRRVPAVDGGVVLQARVGALPGRVGDLAEQVAGGHGPDDRAVRARRQLPVAPVDHGLHELVGHPHRVVGVLVLGRVAVGTVEVHVEAGVTQDAGLALLDRLAPDEVLHVRVVDVEDDHLGGAARLATRLDRCRPRRRRPA